MITKSVSFETTITKAEIEFILRNHFNRILNKEDSDFKDSKLNQYDFTYQFKDNAPSIEMVVLLNSVKMRKPR